MRPQPFEVDFDVEADLAGRRRPTTSPTPSTTAPLIARRRRASSTNERHLLLEKVASAHRRRAPRVLDRVEAVRVTIRKLRPPLPHDVATAAITVRRRRRAMTRAFLALGSNLGDRAAYLRAAVAVLPDVVAESNVYETEPVGGPDGQGAYLNMVVRARHRRARPASCSRCAAATRGRSRARAHRALGATHDRRRHDLDRRRHGRRARSEVPHPLMHERPFVLAPFEELAPTSCRVIGDASSATTA